jgi:hypothetical protein
MTHTIGIGYPNQKLVEREKLLSEIQDPSVRSAFAKASKDLRITSSEVEDLFTAAGKDNPYVPGDSTTPREKQDLERIRQRGSSLLDTLTAQRKFDSKLGELKKRPEIQLADNDAGLRSSQTAVDQISIRGQAAGYMWCPPNARCMRAPSTFQVRFGDHSFQVKPQANESAKSVAQRLAAEMKKSGMSAEVQEQFGVAFVRVGKTSSATDVKLGTYTEMSGKIENRSLVGPGGEAPPSGSYLVLDKPISVEGKQVKEVYVQHWPELTEGAQVKLNGRVDRWTYGGVETPSASVISLSGVSNLSAGEPKFDGKVFTDDQGKTLQQLSYMAPMIMDAPAQIFVLDQGHDKAWLGSMGGMMPPDMNPFHGFRDSAKIEEPTEADRNGVVQGPDGTPRNAQTLKKLVSIGEDPMEGPPYPDMMTSRWYMDEDANKIYRLDSGGIAGMINNMAQVIRLPNDVSPF